MLISFNVLIILRKIELLAVVCGRNADCGLQQYDASLSKEASACPTLVRRQSHRSLRRDKRRSSDPVLWEDDSWMVDQGSWIWLTSISIPCKSQHFQVFLAQRCG